MLNLSYIFKNAAVFEIIR